MDTPGLIQPDSANKRIPFSQQWELQKPLLEKLYLDEGFNLPKIQKIMREENSFDAE
jgi:Clr5 domain